MRNTLPEKQTVTVNGVGTEYSLSGESSPIMVVLNGFRTPMLPWDQLYPEISSAHGYLPITGTGSGKYPILLVHKRVKRNRDDDSRKNEPQ